MANARRTTSAALDKSIESDARLQQECINLEKQLKQADFDCKDLRRKLDYEMSERERLDRALQDAQSAMSAGTLTDERQAALEKQACASYARVGARRRTFLWLQIVELGDKMRKAQEAEEKLRKQLTDASSKMHEQRDKLHVAERDCQVRARLLRRAQPAHAQT